MNNETMDNAAMNNETMDNETMDNETVTFRPANDEGTINDLRPLDGEPALLEEWPLYNNEQWLLDYSSHSILSFTEE